MAISDEYEMSEVIEMMTYKHVSKGRTHTHTQLKLLGIQSTMDIHQNDSRRNKINTATVSGTPEFTSTFHFYREE